MGAKNGIKIWVGITLWLRARIPHASSRTRTCHPSPFGSLRYPHARARMLYGCKLMYNRSILQGTEGMYDILSHFLLNVW